MHMIPFDSGKLPAHIKARKGVANPFAAAVPVGGFPVISIKGKVFHIQRGDERTLVTKPDDPDSPASSLEVVIVGLNPNKSKVYYQEGYQEGNVEKPSCYSNDGLAPAADAQAPQAKKCASCAHNQWGSKITDSGKKAKACADHMRLAAAPAGQVNDPMLLRVPATTLPSLGAYGEFLAKKGYEPHQVVTKVGFDYSVAHPALTFKAIGFVTDDMLAEIEEVSASETVAMIVGTAAAPAVGAEPFEQEAPAAPAVGKSSKLAAAVAEAQDMPRHKVKVEEEEDEAPAPKARKAKPVVDDEETPAPKAKKAPVTVDEIEQGLEDLDFDD